MKQVGAFRRTNAAGDRETRHISSCAVAWAECRLRGWAGACSSEEWRPESIDLGAADVGSGTVAGAEDPCLNV